MLNHIRMRITTFQSNGDQDTAINARVKLEWRTSSATSFGMISVGIEIYLRLSVGNENSRKYQSRCGQSPRLYFWFRMLLTSLSTINPIMYRFPSGLRFLADVMYQDGYELVSAFATLGQTSYIKTVMTGVRFCQPGTV